MDDFCAAAMMEATASKIQQLQKAFKELEIHRAVTLNSKWKQLEEHLNGLQESLKKRFAELEEQGREFDAKIAEANDILEKRKAAILAKEQASLERLQEKRYAAVSVILACMQKKRPYPVDSVVTNQEGVTVVDEKALDSVLDEGNISFRKKRATSSDVRVKSHPDLVRFCREMNSEGLQKFISDNRRDLNTLKEEIPNALGASVDPGTLVLETLEGFYGMEVPNFDAKKDSTLLGRRRNCIMLMECLSRFLIDQNGDYSYCQISENARQKAKDVAENWKPKLESIDADAGNGNSLEAHAFLLLFSTYGINSEFDQESLLKLIPMVSRRRQAAELCRNLGLTEKIPGVIDALIKNGKQIDAVNLAFAFELTDRFHPTSLLQSYLSEAKKAPSVPKGGNTSPTTFQIDVHEKELAALKAVMKCIEDHKLESQFSLESLQKQVLEIEKAKAEKKRATEVAKLQSKRPRATTSAHGHRVSPKAVAYNSYHASRVIDNRYPQYGYEMVPPPYAYPVPSEPLLSPYMGTPAYTFSPNRVNFFGNAYQYQSGYLY